jgi:hypothetical protein
MFSVGITSLSVITPATNSRKSRRSFNQSASLAESLHTTGMRGSAVSHTDENPRLFVPTISCRGNIQVAVITASDIYTITAADILVNTFAEKYFAQNENDTAIFSGAWGYAPPG